MCNVYVIKATLNVHTRDSPLKRSEPNSTRQQELF
jgi:hypothetical protein